MRKKLRKSRTIITLPIGKILINSIAYSVFGVVVLLWTIAAPDDKYEVSVYIIGCALGLMMAAILLSSKLIETEKIRYGFKSVAPGLWQGGLNDEVFSFDKYDFDVAVDLRADSERPNIEVKVPLGKRYIRWPMDDRTLKHPEEVEALAAFLAKKVETRKVGVFCAFGVNRSGLVCAETARLIAEASTNGIEATTERMFNAEFLTHLGKNDERDRGKII